MARRRITYRSTRWAVLRRDKGSAQWLETESIAATPSETVRIFLRGNSRGHGCKTLREFNEVDVHSAHLVKIRIAEVRR